MYLKLLKCLMEPYYWFYILRDVMFFYHEKKQEKNHPMVASFSFREYMSTRFLSN